MIHIGNEWDALLKDEFKKEYYLDLRGKLANEYATRTIYPDKYDIFNALKYTSYNDVSVAILGQDPYHGPRQAHGLAFSVQEGVDIPPSLVNIFKEIDSEFGCGIPNNGCLVKWANQGVLLLNATLTVRAGTANSHSTIGWETFTDNIIQLLNEREKPIVFLLWGNNAKKKARHVVNSQHLLLQTVHPSPLSAHAGFFGCNHFKKANEFLDGIGRKVIDWAI